MPADVAEYLKSIANTVTPQGNLVRVNVPDAAVPKPTIPASGVVPALPTGTFGPVTAENHNSYECYISPHVTAQLVEETTRQNAERAFNEA